MKARESTRRLTFWSAAASSGQEAYSLAILLLEMGLLGAGLEHPDHRHGPVQPGARSRPRRRATCRSRSTAACRRPYLVRYFSKQGLEWQLKDNIRSMASFQKFDLRQSPTSLGTFDVIFCRNVLIYFDVPTKKKILGGLRNVLRDDGCLLLGGAEAILDLDGGYARQVVGQASVYRKAVS